MAETIFRGPGVVAGSLMDNTINPMDGPSIWYQATVIPDARLGPLAKDGLSPGRVPGAYNTVCFPAVDTIPQLTSTTIVAAAQAPSTTVGVALNLKTAQVGVTGVASFCPGVPIIPVGTSSVVTVSAIDFGFATGTTIANSSSIITNDNTLFTVGQWIVIPGAGPTTLSALITQVQSVSGSTQIFVNPLPVTAVTANAIGQGNLYSLLLPPAASFGPAAVSANAAEPFRLCGLAKAYDPVQMSARNITVQSALTASGTTAMIVTGYDVYGNAMSELIVSSGTSATAGKKAFKYIAAIKVAVAGTTATVPNMTVGLGDLVGFPYRCDRWEYTEIFYKGGQAQNNAGWSAAVITASSTTSGDTRGVQNFSTVIVGSSTNGTSVTGNGLDGAGRVVIIQNLPLLTAINASPTVATSLFGVPQT